MLRRLLFIAGEVDLFHQTGISRYLSRERGFDCKVQRWDPATPLNESPYSVELILVAAGGQSMATDVLCRWLRTQITNVPVVAILSRDCDHESQRPLIRVADDFIFTPVDARELQCRIEGILGAPAEQEPVSRQRLKEELGLAQFAGEDPEFLKAISQIPLLAASSAPVLLLGETGTGKELCAQAIHALSPRHAGPFIPVECSAIPENLIENELFGHVRGAFTDAHNEQNGLVALAEGGTFFLDEIDSLPATAQAKLLRFVQEGTYRPLGAQKFLRADLRVIAAANRDLGKCVREGHFRSDLYFRLNVLPLHLPPLRERRSDILKLAKYFLRALLPSEAVEKKLSTAAARSLEAYSWPGNVRELYNTIQRAATFSPDASILPIHLGLPDTGAAAREAGTFESARSRVIEDFEKAYVEDILHKNNGNVTRAAAAAGKDRRVFGRLMKRYGIERSTYL